ncbi:Bro-N domain-containing protein [Methylobacterium sp. J-068]|uniref:BRO-N domain-containing protein n=1 Tax=Methylobacterium sp. J-068 TaxID=2836649 RepID=UPI001FBB8FE8|nr:BRO family protein [Methylobacterium sp. J-068]MCJ2033048.1 hypothetical protein [Methylobacterium sp. J-068]
MGDLTPYQFEGQNLRIVQREGEPWFVATDAARMLGHRDAADLNRSMDADEKGTQRVRTPGGEQEMSVISEAGLYRAIVQRRATDAIPAETRARIARFQRWVFHDVLPAIRKTGRYEGEAHPAAPGSSLAASAREARLFLKQALDIGKIAGLSGNQLLIAASRSTHRAVGFDMLGSMEITHLVAPVQDPLVIPSKIGQDLGVSAVQVNHLLQEIGFQIGDRDHKDRPFWKLTPAGEEFGGTLVDVERSNRTGPAQQLRWPGAIVGVLHDHMDRRTG